MQKAESKVFQKPALADADFARARELRAAALRPFRPYEHRVGNSQLSRLWDQSIMLDDEQLLAHNAECVGPSGCIGLIAQPLGVWLPRAHRTPRR